jgi:peptidoglycan hydrolase CwlO-like protein
MSEKKEIIRYVDKSQITAVKFKFPALMSDNADKMVRECHKTFLDAQNALNDARNKVRELEKEFEKAKEDWNEMQKFAEIDFLTKEKETFTAESNSMIFKGYGNSTLGYSNY